MSQPFHHFWLFHAQFYHVKNFQNAMRARVPRALRRASSLLKLCLFTSAFVTPHRPSTAQTFVALPSSMPFEEVDEDRVWAAHRRFQLEEDVLRDFGPTAGGENASQSIACQRHRAERLAEGIMKQSNLPAESYFFQGSSSRSTFMTVAHSQLSDFDVVFLCDGQWLQNKGANAFADLANALRQVVSDFGREELHYMGRELQVDEHQFTFVEGRCGVELKVSVDHAWCEDESTDLVLAYRNGTEPGAIVVFDKWMNRWRNNNPVRLAALIKEVEEKQPYYGMIIRMLKEWNQHCPRIRQTRTGTVMGGVTILDNELPPEFGGPRDTIVLRSFPDGPMKSFDGNSPTKMKRPMTGLHIEMALCLQHDGYRNTFWAKQLNSSKNLRTRAEGMLANEPETPCAIDLLVAAVEHLIATLAIPIGTPGDDMYANEAMLNDPELVQSTQEILYELLRELQTLQQEPDTPDATSFLRSRLLRNPKQWNDYWHVGRWNPNTALIFVCAAVWY